MTGTERTSDAGEAPDGDARDAGEPRRGRVEHELKARLTEETEAALRRRIRETGWRRVFRGRMRDRRYDTPDGALDARDEVLRIRRFEPHEGPGEVVLGWKGPASRRGGFKARPEIEVRVADAEAQAALLERLGYGEVTMAIDREVEVFAKGGLTLRIERYPRMDTLAELEGPPDVVESRLGALGLPREAWTPWPLPRFVEEFEARTGRRAILADSGSPDRDEEAGDAGDRGTEEVP